MDPDFPEVVESDLRTYGLSMSAYRAVLSLRVRLCPPGQRQLLRDTMIAEVNSAVADLGEPPTP